ncbi:DUF3575 domain-containing protein [Lutibacter sp.]
MKKIVITLFLVGICVSGFAQEKSESSHKKNELKINMSNLVVFKWMDIAYERIINEEASLGVSVLISLDPTIDGLDEYRTFSVTPYYRHFFSDKYAQGFFVEAFGMLHSGKDYSYLYTDFPPYDSVAIENNYTDLAVGISAGAKFVTKRGFVAEFYFGIGRDLLNNSDIEVVGRGGISIGYRFQ